MKYVMSGLMACTLLMFSAAATQAGFRDNFSQWQEMDAYAQSSYVMGLFDSQANASTVGEEKWVSAKRAGIEDCALQLKLKPGMITGAITRHFEQHQRDWGIPVATVFNRVVQNVCLDFINARRSAADLPLWKPSVGGILDTLSP